MHVRVHGEPDRPTILCLHPLASSGALWDRFATWLVDRGFRVIAPDIPGDGPYEGLTVDRMAEDAALAIVEDGGGPVDVIGLSMGGCIAVQLAIAHPELVRRLVLADTTASYGPTRIEDWEDRAVRALLPREEQLEFQLPRWFTADFRAEQPEECQRIADIFVQTPSAGHAASCLALGRFDVVDQLDQVHATTLVLVGDQDEATPPSMARALAEGIDKAELAMIREAGHLSLVQGGAAWDRVSGFLARIPDHSPQ